MSTKGTQHFIAQRITALLLIPTIIWFLVSMVGHFGSDRAEIYAWLSDRTTAMVMAVFLLALFFHMRLGMQEVIDDYIANPDTRSMLSFLNTFFALVIGGIAFWSILSITLTA